MFLLARLVSARWAGEKLVLTPGMCFSIMRMSAPMPGYHRFVLTIYRSRITGRIGSGYWVCGFGSLARFDWRASADACALAVASSILRIISSC